MATSVHAFIEALEWALAAKAAGDLEGAAQRVHADWGPAAGLGLTELLARPGTTAAKCVEAAIVLHAGGCFDLAIVACERAVLIEPDSSLAWPALAWLLPATGRRAALPDLYVRWAAARPGDATAVHMRAATQGESLDRASNGYVRELFDEFARSFDATLERLDYRVPEAIASAMTERWAELPERPDALDLGCGTGLVGLRLRPHVGRLVGVDLSEAMLERARDRGIYDALECSDMIEAMTVAPEAHDLVVAGDVLVYVGALGPVAAAVATTLRPGGLFLATTEIDDDAGDGRLTPSGRFSHARDALGRALQRADLEVCSSDAIVLRSEGGQPVSGCLTVGRRPRSGVRWR